VRLAASGFDFFMVDQLAVIGLLNRFVNVGVELLVLFDQTESGLLDQLLGGSADNWRFAKAALPVRV
jgi:hypothetical protein